MTFRRFARSATVAALASAAVLGWAQQPPIRVAHIDTFSGPTASTGATVAKTLLYAVQRINERGGVLGRKFEVVQMDNAGDSNKAVASLTSTVDQNIRLLVQAGNSGIAGALLTAVDKHNQRNPDKRVLYLNYGSALPELTEAKCSFWMFRFEAHQRMKMRAIADYVAKTPSIQKIYLLNQDYSFGHEVSKDAREIIGKARADVQFVGDEFHPFGKIKDFSPYVLKIKQAGADTVLTGNWGNDLALLVRASKEAGLKTKYITYYGGLYGVPTAIGPAGEDTVLQIASWHPNVPVEDKQPELEKLQKDFKANFGEDLYYTSILVQMDMLAKAIEKVGNADDVAAIARALEGMEYDSPFGKIKMRKDDHQATHPLYINQLVKGVKYDAEGLGLGWKTVAKVDGSVTEPPLACKMKRPD
ncbi:MAG TPA: branched-chain amino acid ABC transporter substrate-binding protein [Comamonadaceae bacterium]|uniref:branched-chain amino acid ABC transporter substrate-binding protein n=1 Tax=Pulveribacter sp. TaxID=2678893 RepID=UPI000ECFBC89|nr:branched-chain amino acid ABC transporter substrate-binding protein [Pulveribacter sp.]HCL87581.1 branched-chain amino acid ABC transporter substrate-binding protein [Comamonadaceae bacterium]